MNILNEHIVAFARVRIKAIEFLLASTTNDIHRRYLSNGKIPNEILNGKNERDFLREYYFEKYPDTFQLENFNNDTPLTSLELSRFNTWFFLHPEKIGGIEIETSSLFFPVQIKGTEKDVQNIFETLPRLKNNNKTDKQKAIAIAEAEAEAVLLLLRLEETNKPELYDLKPGYISTFNNNVLYHYGNIDNIPDNALINELGIHLGSLEIVEKLQKTNKKGTIKKYKFSGDFINTIDFARWEAFTVGRYLMQNKIITKNEFEKINKNSGDYKDKALIKLLKDKGYNGFAYYNYFESSKNSLCVCVFDKKNLTEVKTNKPEQTEKEITIKAADEQQAIQNANRIEQIVKIIKRYSKNELDNTDLYNRVNDLNQYIENLILQFNPDTITIEKIKLHSWYQMIDKIEKITYLKLADKRVEYEEVNKIWDNLLTEIYKLYF